VESREEPQDVNPALESRETGLGPKRQAARQAATHLAPRHPDLGYNLLYAAAQALIERGEREPRDRRVLDEARRRFRQLREAAIVQFRRSGNEEAVAETEAEISKVCGT
jgi:hypothetical protein